MKKQQQGIVWVPILIIVVTIIVTGVAGYVLFVADNPNKSKNTKIEVANQTNNNASANKGTKNLNASTNTNTNTNTNAPLGQPIILENSAVVTDGVVTITWKTDQPTDGLVKTGETTMYTGPILTPTVDNGGFNATALNEPRPKVYTTRHSVKMFVGSNKTYHYKIQSCAEHIIDRISGCTQSPDYTFST